MSRFDVRDPLKPVVERAVELSRQPDMVARESGAGFSVSTHEDSATQTDEDGNTIHIMLWDVDYWDDLNSVWGE